MLALSWPMDDTVCCSEAAAVSVRDDRSALPEAISPDAVLMPVGWDIYLRVHEIGSHSLLGSLGIAALSALVVRLSVRGSRYPRLVAAAWIGGLSHLALDILSGAQVLLGWPLTNGRMSLPLVAMAEPVLIAIFLIGSFALLMAGSQARRQRLAAAVVLAVALYFTRVDLRKEREKDEARHTATMDVLNAIKSFMEVIKDRIPRS